MSELNKFCFLCGKPTTVVNMDFYDTETGNRLTTHQCLNRKCRSGCLYLNGCHDYGFFGFSSYCKKCGMPSYD